jgi:hypothetical protein
VGQIAFLEGIDLGRLHTKGRHMRSRLSALPPPLEFSDSGFGFLGEIVTKEIAIDSGLSILGGAAFMLDGDKIVAWRFAAANLLVGAVAGRALWNVGAGKGRAAAQGLLGAAGANIARAAMAMIKGGVKANLGDLAVDYDDDIDLASLSADPEDILLSDVGVEQRQLLGDGGFEDAEVGERRPGQLADIGAWIS